MITLCTQCDSVMTICKDDMVCTSCGHSYRYKNFSSLPVRLPKKSQKCSKVGQEVADAPARFESFENWENMPGVEME